MTWVTWRQQRLETLLVAAALALIALFLVKTGLDVYGGFQRTGLAACLSGTAQAPSCPLNLDAFRQQVIPLEYPLYQGLVFVPLVVGLLLGAPFVVDLEQGTYRLAWTQSITRRRWVLVRLALIVSVAAAAGAVLAALTTWWWGPLTRITDRLDRNPFELIGVVPIAYTVFAAALCVASGALLRRTVPAVGITLAGFVALRLWFQGQLRYNVFLAPLTKLVPAGAGPGLASGDYIVSRRMMVPPDIWSACTHENPNVPVDRLPVLACFAQHGVMQTLIYQPADRFWALQGIETAIFLGLAAVLLAVTVWWVRRLAA